MEPGKYGVDPYDTEHAGSHDDKDRRDDSLSDSARSRDRAVHKRRKTVRKCHDFDSLHAGVNDCCIRGKQRQELMSEDKEEQSKDQSDRE